MLQRSAHGCAVMCCVSSASLWFVRVEKSTRIFTLDSGIQGYLEVSLEVMPKGEQLALSTSDAALHNFQTAAEADSKPNGQGQEAPNEHPELPKPTGRKPAPFDVAGKASAMWENHKWKIFMLILLAAIGCGIGVWFYFTYGPGALIAGGDGGSDRDRDRRDRGGGGGR